MRKIIIFSLIGIATVGLLFLLFFRDNNVVPQLTVSDQVIQDQQVTIESVTAVATSWLVIQTETNGVPGPVIGYTKINKGENKNVSVKIDTVKSTPKLYAMIHEDSGEKGKFDFPNNDMPLIYNGEMLSKLFVIK